MSTYERLIAVIRAFVEAESWTSPGRSSSGTRSC